MQSAEFQNIKSTHTHKINILLHTLEEQQKRKLKKFHSVTLKNFKILRNKFSQGGKRLTN